MATKKPEPSKPTVKQTAEELVDNPPAPVDLPQPNLDLAYDYKYLTVRQALDNTAYSEPGWLLVQVIAVNTHTRELWFRRASE